MKKLFVVPSKKETAWGAGWLALELLLLPSVLVLLNGLLPRPLTEAQLNLVFFFLNFLAATLIFRKFLAATAVHALTCLGRLLYTALLGLGRYWILMLLMGMLILSIDPDFSNINDASVAAMAQQGFLPTAVGTIALVPLAEELLFRGALFGGLYPKNRIAAWTLSTVCFAAVHITGYIGLAPWDTLLLCFLQYLPAGYCLAWAYRHSGSILTPVLMHTAINAYSIFIMR